MNITIVDYGAGNLRSAANAFYLAGADPVIASDPDDVANAERVVLPGVGAAGPALSALRGTGMADALDLARSKGTPIMGICLGMQMMARRLDEFGSHEGLGWIPGHAGPIQDNARLPCRVPHTGWSEITAETAGDGLIGSGPRDRFVYFCHSNCLTTDESLVAATVDCGGPLVAAIRHEALFAVQFHPEKSQLGGERILKAFLDWKP